MSAKMIILLIVVILFLVFIFQNIEIVNVSFLMFDINMPRSLLLIVTFVAGALTGIFVLFEFKKRKNKNESI